MIKELEENKKFSIVFIIIVALEIFLVSSIPGSLTPSGFDLSVFYHFISFFLLNFFILIYVRDKERGIGKKLILVLAISLTYAVLDELHQFFVPLRTPDVMDFLVDSAGIFLSALVYRYYSKSKFFHKKTNQ